MSSRSVAKLTVLLCAMVAPLKAFAQSSASVVLDREVVNAGDDLKTTIKLVPASSFAGDLYLDFVGPNGATFYGSLRTTTDSDSSDLTLKVPIDAPGGIYVLRTLWFGLSVHTALQHQPVTVTVIPTSQLVRPSSASVVLSPTQQQFLKTKSDDLASVLARLTTRLRSASADTPELRSYVVSMLEDAHGRLLVTRDQYERLFPVPTGQPQPDFFSDFDALYRAMLIQIRVMHAYSGRQHFQEARYSQRQLKARPKTLDQPELDYIGTMPPYVMAAIDLVGWNRTAYEIVQTTGASTFLVDLSSTPPGADISFGKATKQATSYFEKTDLTNRPFPLAVWSFTFELNGCKQTLIANPYINPHPRLSAELSCKKR